MIGFVMCVFYPADEDYPLDSRCVERLMIDSAYQGKGYGHTALRLFLAYFEYEYGSVDLRMATDAANKDAIRIYEKAGFVETGEVAAGEMVFHVFLGE